MLACWLLGCVSLQAQNAACGADLKAADRKAYDEALAHYGQRRYKEAAQQMRRVASHNPQSADAQFWLGMIAVKDGFNATAIRRYFGKCIELCPDYPNALAHYYMGVVHYTDEAYDEAVVELNKYFNGANAANEAACNVVYEEASNYLYWSEFLSQARLNQVPFDPQRVAGVSSKHSEMLPYMSPDGHEFFYLRQVPEKKEVTVYSQDFEVKRWKLFRSVWADTAFTRGEELPAPFNQGPQEGNVTLTADGRTLYYSQLSSRGGYSNSDLYRVRRDAAGWHQPEALGGMINGEHSWESQPSVTPDGSVLFFASNRQGGLGGIDIWRCRRLKNGDWSRPENMGASVNTAGNEKFPFVAADGHTLYFLSDGWQGFGGYDVYFVDLADPDGGRPANLGLPINSEGDEGLFGVTTDGRRAYYASGAADGKGTDVMMFDLYPSAQPEPMRLCRVRVENGAGATLRLLRDGAPEAVYEADTAGPTAVMLSCRVSNTLVATDEGMLPEVRVIGASEVNSGRASGKDIVLKKNAVGAQVRIPYAVGSEDLQRWLAAWVDYLVENPRVHLAIECRRKADAKEIYDFFVGHKLRAERFTYRGGTDIEQPRLTVQ